MGSEGRGRGAGTAAELFTCRMCGDCCRGYGGTYLTEEDIVAIATFLGQERERFLADCSQISGGRPVLAQGENGYCLFWDGLCTIHPVKPRMCRAWPFIAGVLVDVRNWHIMAACCPGMRTDVPDEDIRAHVRRELCAFNRL